MVRIEGFHPFGPGSIPGIGKMGQFAKPPRGCPGLKPISNSLTATNLNSSGGRAWAFYLKMISMLAFSRGFDPRLG